jgi:hypothetical protein
LSEQTCALPFRTSDWICSVVCYLISRRNTPIAIVRTNRMAQQIVRCRPRGYYAIKKVTVDADSPSARGIHVNQLAARALRKTTSHQQSASTSKTPRKLSPGK